MDLRNIYYGVLMGLAFIGVIFAVDKLDQRKAIGEVNTIYQGVAIRFKTDDGNLWLVETDDTEGVECGDEYILTFKEYENTNIYDDAIVKYKPIQ